MNDTDAVLRFVFIGAAIAAALLVWYRVGQVYYRYRLSSWARSNDQRLIDFQGAKFWEGPMALRRTENQSAFYVETEDRHGRRRHAYVVFGRRWGFDAWATTTVEWDD
mgnify:CR=1 FL=1